MKLTNIKSESLVGSLCREIQFINSRSLGIKRSLENCQNPYLSKRLSIELNSHYSRKNSIMKIAQYLNTINYKKDLSILFLLEISQRELILS